jgi:hypothetical protein
MVDIRDSRRFAVFPSVLFLKNVGLVAVEIGRRSMPTGRIIGKGRGASDRGAVHGRDHRRWSAGVRGVHLL